MLIEESDPQWGTFAIQAEYENDGARKELRLNGEWPERLLVSDELLQNGDPAYVTFSAANGTLRFDVANGHAVYHYLGHDDLRPQSAWKRGIWQLTKQEVPI